MAATGSRVERTPRGQGERLRERLVEAAVGLIDADGLGAVTIRAATRGAGVSPNAFYLHFASRRELVFACVERCFAQFRDALRGGAADAGDPREALMAAGLAYVDFARAFPERYAVLFLITGVGEDDPAINHASGDEAFTDLVALVHACEGPDLSEDEASALAEGIWAGLHGYVTLVAARPEQGWPEPGVFLDRLADAWLGAG